MAFLLQIDGTVFRDGNGREVILRGINLAADAKLPRHPDQSSHNPQDFLNGDNVSFVGRPFEINDADIHFCRLRNSGYNTIRYIFTWEALEAAGPAKYDEEWIQHTISVLRIAKSYGFYVFMDPHQDVWSRFTGGSGAPMWTLYACGLNPEAFSATEAALVQNTWPIPAEFPKMIWATNYQRLACSTIFTLFWAGREYAAHAIIDGKNVQDYLQDHFFAACGHLALRIKQAGDLDDSCIIGWETMNEPNRGLIGLQDMSVFPSDIALRKGTSPTFWQAILTGSGITTEVEVWDVGSTGPHKTGKELIDPRGQSAWLPAGYDDTRYGWKRDPGWKLGKCLWAQAGVWDRASQKLIRPDHFAKDPRNGETVNHEYFTNHWFLDFVRRYRAMIRHLFPNTILFCQPPTLELPPTIKGTVDDDPNMVYTPHWYDGLTLMTKKWNRLWNVDVVGILRGRYLSPVFAIRFGETAIRKCFRDQLQAIHQEGMDNMGGRPCLFSEFGIPFDMEDGKAYATGDYSSQIAAMDANHFAVEANKLHYTLWTYCVTNTHQWGDQWNGEDLSIYSTDDTPPPVLEPSSNISPTASTSSDINLLKPLNSEAPLLRPTISATSTLRSAADGPQHYRAAAAFLRPFPMASHTNLVSYSFALRSAEFNLKVDAQSSAPKSAPTEVFLPEFHFPRNQISVEASDGKWEIVIQRFGAAELQVLRWWHGGGEQSLTVRGVVRPKIDGGVEQDEGYLSRCFENGCGLM